MVDDVKLAPNELICVYNSHIKCHQVFPKDYILIIAPLWQLSEVIEGVNQLPGRSLITLKTQSQIPVNETLDELVELLGIRVIGALRNADGGLIIKPPDRPQLQVVTASDALDPKTFQ